MGHSTPSLTLPPRGGGNFTPSPAAAGEGGGGGRRTAVMLSAAKHQNGPAMPSAAKHPWLPRSFGLRPQDDKRLPCRAQRSISHERDPSGSALRMTNGCHAERSEASRLIEILRAPPSG